MGEEPLLPRASVQHTVVRCPRRGRKNCFCCAPVYRVLPPGAGGRKNRFCYYQYTARYRSMPLAGEEPLLPRISVQRAIARCPGE